jgi:hypothetical protein
MSDPNQRTITREALLIIDSGRQFAVLRAMKLHLDQDGLFCASNKRLAKWASEVMLSEAPLTEEEREILASLMLKNGLSENFVFAIMDQGFSLRTIMVGAASCREERLCFGP